MTPFVPDDRGSKRTRIVIVDDIADTTENIAKLIGFEPDMEVVGEAFDGAEGVLVARDSQPDVVLMDICMPVMDGIAATAQLTSTPGWRAPIVVMSVQGEQDYLRRAQAAGASEYLVKPFSADELIEAIRRVSPMPAPAPVRNQSLDYFPRPLSTTVAAKPPIVPAVRTPAPALPQALDSRPSPPSLTRRAGIVLLAAFGADQVMAVITTPMMAGASPLEVLVNLGMFAVVPLAVAWRLTRGLSTERRIFGWTVGIISAAAFLLHQVAFNLGLL